ncbi:MAG: lytic transglycosylase domain-containing protein [Steroidobacteraceae bacterium]
MKPIGRPGARLSGVGTAPRVGAPRVRPAAARRGSRKRARARGSGKLRFLRGLKRLWPRARARRRAWRLFRGASGLVQLVALCAVCGTAALAVNGVYQVLRKPTELLFPVSGTLAKLPAETWRDYGSLFRRYATRRLSPEFLAALAQVEGSGNPIARTDWRWSWRPHFFELYRPASSAVGMYQITDGTFAQARHYCIRDHVVLSDHVVLGAVGAARRCWLNGLYFRVIPSDAVELTSAYLDARVESTLAQAGIGSVTSRQAERLAAVIHLCGAGAGEAYVIRGLRFRAGERCGEEDPRSYVARVEAMREVFARLAAHG